MADPNHPSMFQRPDAGRRVITGANIRAARDYLTARRERISGWTCEERVLLAVTALIGGVGSPTNDEIACALHEIDTVDLALDLLTEIGAPCAQ